MLLNITTLVFNANVNAEQSRKILIIDIPQFGKIDNNFYRGSYPDNKQFAELKKLGIKSVINLRLTPLNNDKKEKVIVQSYGMKYYNIPMTPMFPPTKKQVSQFFKIINNHKNTPVFVYCHQGKDRTGIMSALYRIERYNWTYEQAYAEMKSYGYHKYLYPAQKFYLKKYAKKVHK